MSDKATGGGFNPRAEPGRLTTKEISEINQIYAGNLQQFADNNMRSTEQIAKILNGAPIKGFVWVGAVAASLQILHDLLLAAQFIFRLKK